jgi:hypothetical protein
MLQFEEQTTKALNEVTRCEFQTELKEAESREE